MMKKLLVLLLTLLLALSLAACGGSDDGQPGNDAPERQEEELAAATEDDAPETLVNDGAASYAEAYGHYTGVYNALNDAYYAILDPHNTQIEENSDAYWEDPNHFADIVTLFVNMPIGFTATFGESGYQDAVATVFDMFGMVDGQIEELGDGQYRMTYKQVYNDPETYESYESAAWEAECGFDSGSGSLHFRQYVTVDGQQRLDSFVEFVPLGGGRYALQTKVERGIVELVDGAVTSFEYAAFNQAFDPDADAIYPAAANADAAWITAGNDMFQHITLTADSLHIWAAAIPDGILAVPERDITIER